MIHFHLYLGSSYFNNILAKSTFHIQKRGLLTIYTRVLCCLVIELICTTIGSQKCMGNFNKLSEKHKQEHTMRT